MRWRGAMPALLTSRSIWPKLSQRLVHQPLAVAVIGARRPARSAPRPPPLAPGASASSAAVAIAAIVDDDRPALFGQRQRNAAADAAPGAGDQCDFLYSSPSTLLTASRKKYSPHITLSSTPRPFRSWYMPCLRMPSQPGVSMARNSGSVSVSMICRA